MTFMQSSGPLGSSLTHHSLSLVPRRSALPSLCVFALGLCMRAAPARANIVTEWNTRAAAVVNEQNPMDQSRSFAIVQIAVHDALNGVEPRYAPYAYQGYEPEACAEAAIATAAHDALLAVAPSHGSDLDAWYQEALAAIPEGTTKAAGIELGRAAAERIVTLRATDDLEGALLEPYEPGTEPGDYQPTPPDNAVFGAAWGKLPTFAAPRSSAFRPPPPPAVSSKRYLRDYEEIKSIGVQNSDSRTPEQSEIADFWYESATTGWIRIANSVVAEQGLDLWESARVLGLVSISLVDGFITGFDAKYHYAFWRPITGIRAGEDDGNPWTQGDPEWTPYCATPPVADYPSTHALLGAAAAAVLARYFGDKTPFTATSLTLPGVERSFDSFTRAARENADSRVYCGIHWRSSVEAGLRQGRRLGRYVFGHELGSVRSQPGPG